MGASIVSLGLALSACGGSRTQPSSHPLTFKGIPVGFTTRGYPYLGNAAAPVTVEEFSDFLCPFCARHFRRTLPTLVRDFVAKGEVRYVFRDMPLRSLHPNAPQGHVAARCVAAQGPPLFWAMHDELFRTQERWRDLPDPAAYLADAAAKAGADVREYERCLAGGAQTAWVEQSIELATRKLKLDATPTFRLSRGRKTYTLVGAYPLDTFEAWLRALVAGKRPPPQVQPKRASPPYWASAKGLAPDPARPGFTTAGDPYRGARTAPVTVVEFSNFACSACRKQEAAVQPDLQKTFVERGKVRWVFKNLLLKGFPNALAAAAAAECAGDQERFWQMHDLLFATQADWKSGPPDRRLERLGRGLGLDMRRFVGCLGGRQAAERVLNDVYDAEAVTTTAPTYVIVSGGQGVVVRGVPTVARLSGLIRSQLRAVTVARPGVRTGAPASRASRPPTPAGRAPATLAKVELGTTDLAVGRNRVSFVVLDSSSRPVDRPTARLRLARGSAERPEVETTARLEPVGAPGSDSSDLQVYVGSLDIPAAGEYRVLAEPVGGGAVRAVGSVRVRARAAAPTVGDRAVPVRNPTADGASEAREITTARPPDVALLHVSVQDALAAGRPFVVTFASPLFCRKRDCGPVVDIVQSAAKRWRGRGVAFIHVDVYERNDVRNGYDEWVRAWHLPSDPFTYVVDGRGVIRTKLEGPFSARELDAAVRAVAPPR